MNATIEFPRTRKVDNPHLEHVKPWFATAKIEVFGADKLQDAHREAQRLGFFLDPTGECHSLAPRQFRKGGRRQAKLMPTPENLALLGFNPDEVKIAAGNLATTVGLMRLFNLLIGTATTQAFDSTHTAIGVGDTATAAAVGDSDLTAAQLATNRFIQPVSGANVVTTGPPTLITVASTFATGNGNFHWQEWGIGQNTAASGTVALGGTASGSYTGSANVLLNHKVVDLGTKTSNAAWAFSVTFTIT